MGIENNIDIEFNLDDIDLDLELFDEELDLSRIKNSIDTFDNELEVIEVEVYANGSEYKYYILVKNENLVKEFGTKLKYNQNTFGYLYPDLENVYNWRYLDSVAKRGKFKKLKIDRFSDEMKDTVKNNDQTYKLIKSFLGLFTLREGVEIDAI